MPEFFDVKVAGMIAASFTTTGLVSIAGSVAPRVTDGSIGRTGSFYWLLQFLQEKFRSH